MPLTPRIKICCIGSVAEARLAVAAGADALGLVSSMPSGPGVIGDDLIAEIAAATPPGIGTFLLTARTDAAAIAEQHGHCGTTTIQLVDHVPAAELRRLRRALPAVTLVQVIHVVGPESLEAAVAAAPLVDALLLDSGNPAAAIRELGGTGRVHDWAVSARIAAAVATPVYLAGGLRADNVRAAVAAVRPFGIDVCSGVREHGALSAPRVQAFIEAARRPD